MFLDIPLAIFPTQTHPIPIATSDRRLSFETKSPITQGKNNKIVGNWHPPIYIHAQRPFPFLCPPLSNERLTSVSRTFVLPPWKKTSPQRQPTEISRSSVRRFFRSKNFISAATGWRVILENLISILSSVLEIRYRFVCFSVYFSDEKREVGGITVDRRIQIFRRKRQDKPGAEQSRDGFPGGRICLAFPRNLVCLWSPRRYEDRQGPASEHPHSLRWRTSFHREFADSWNTILEITIDEGWRVQNLSVNLVTWLDQSHRRLGVIRWAEGRIPRVRFATVRINSTDCAGAFAATTFARLLDDEQTVRFRAPSGWEGSRDALKETAKVKAED